MTLDQERAAAAIPKLLPADRAESSAAMVAIRRILAADGLLPDESKRRLARVEGLFGETTANSGSSKQRELSAAE
jgi:hypothetical protein